MKHKRDHPDYKYQPRRRKTSKPGNDTSEQSDGSISDKRHSITSNKSRKLEVKPSIDGEILENGIKSIHNRNLDSDGNSPSSLCLKMMSRDNDNKMKTRSNRVYLDATSSDRMRVCSNETPLSSESEQINTMAADASYGGTTMRNCSPSESLISDPSVRSDSSKSCAVVTSSGNIDEFERFIMRPDTNSVNILSEGHCQPPYPFPTSSENIDAYTAVAAANYSGKDGDTINRFIQSQARQFSSGSGAFNESLGASCNVTSWLQQCNATHPTQAMGNEAVMAAGGCQRDDQIFYSRQQGYRVPQNAPSSNRQQAASKLHLPLRSSSSSSTSKASPSQGTETYSPSTCSTVTAFNNVKTEQASPLKHQMYSNSASPSNQQHSTADISMNYHSSNIFLPDNITQTQNSNKHQGYYKSPQTYEGPSAHNLSPNSHLNSPTVTSNSEHSISRSCSSTSLACQVQAQSIYHIEGGNIFDGNHNPASGSERRYSPVHAGHYQTRYQPYVRPTVNSHGYPNCTIPSTHFQTLPVVNSPYSQPTYSPAPASTVGYHHVAWPNVNS